ncbi:MAG TPA: UDP-glucose--tetrahydrobiopterin glucosyltransferase, partial [Cyanobacteria bacterium UBA11368]|nr:UDP-glucose--tetrahydrobiopterin glucosyltransferase [Cyanobacteria bacterium UBA11368]
AFPSAPIDYLGFLSTDELQQQLRECRALLMTPRWVEAFGNVAIEALACGVPVISYRRGGPTEIVRDGETGFLVEPDSVDGLIEAIGKLDTINRKDCRARAEVEYSLEALSDRFDAWFQDIVG